MITPQFVDSQIPNPYYPDKWYPVDLSDNRKWEARRTSGRGKCSQKHYIHIRRVVDLVIRDPDGNEISRTPDGAYIHGRAELPVGEWVIVD